MDALPATRPALPEDVSAPSPALVAVPAAPAAMPWLTAATWHLATRVLFRFCVAYFGTYVLFTQMLGGMTLANWRLQVAWPMRDLVLGAAKRVFHIDRELVLFSGSGDKTYDWVQAFIMLSFAATVTLVWSLADRRHRAYPGVHKWFHLFLRFALGSTMMGYGMAKLIPLQMPFPPLLRLIEPYGNFSPMGVLWYSIGASRPYEMFTGSVEVLAGVLLFIPWTSPAGALVALAATTQIFMLNMTYDVPVKLFSFHLILMSLCLLAPDLKRLLNVLVLNRTAAPSRLAPLARTPWLKWALIGLQLVWGAYLVGHGLQGSVQAWYSRGGGAPKPPLYGIWVVEEMTLDGRLLPPLLTEKERWRRIIIQSPTAFTIQRMDDSLVGQAATIDLAKHSIAMTQPAAPPTGMPPPAFPQSTDSGTFAFAEPEPDVLVVDGDLGGRTIQARLVRYDLNQFLLLTRGFSWVQEFPFNR
jgi:hypothetical protein